MKHWQRLFAYITGSIVFGLLIVIATQSFFEYVSYPGWIGYVTLMAYGLIYLNFSYLINRRFTQKRKHPSHTVSYLMATLMVVPTLLWIFSKETALGESTLVFALTIVFGVYLGAYYGISGGIKKRAKYLEERRKQEQEGDLPEDLQRPHDELSRN